MTSQFSSDEDRSLCPPAPPSPSQDASESLGYEILGIRPAAPNPPNLPPPASTNDNDPDPDPNKKARIDATVATPGNKNYRSPLQQAESFISSHVASLHTGIATLLLDRGKEHLLLSHKIFNKDFNSKRMETDNEYIPVSARVDFALQPAKEVRELPEFHELQLETSTLVNNFQRKLKKQIIACAKLEIKTLQTRRNVHFCESVYLTVSLFHLAYEVDERTTVHSTVHSIFMTYGTALLKYLSMSLQEFSTLYQTTMNVPSTIPIQHVAPTSDPAAAAKQAIESVFVFSWERYIAQARANEVALSIQKKAKEHLQTAKTEAATMIVDDELPTDRQTLNDLIQRQATKVARDIINKQLNTVINNKGSNRTTRAKNLAPRRTNDPSASTKKKSGSSPPASHRQPKAKSETSQGQTTRNRNRGRSPRRKNQSSDPPAGASDNASNGNKKNNTRSRSRKRNKSKSKGTKKGAKRS